MGNGMSNDLKRALKEYSLSGASGSLLQEAKELADNPNDNPYYELIVEAMLVKDHAEACVLLGNHYELGYGVHQNEDTAKHLFNRAVDSGNILGHYCLGWHYYDKADYMRAIDEFDQALKNEEQLNDVQIMDAHTCLGDAYTKLSEPKYSEAVMHLSIASDKYGNAFAKRKLGYIYSDRATRMYDPRKSMGYLRSAADDGDLTSCQQLASYFIDGVEEAGIERDYHEAERILLPHADCDDFDVLNSLGWIYFYGDEAHGFPSDNEKAEHYYRKAMDIYSYNARTASNLGFLCYTGGKYREAEKYLGYAASNGNLSFTDFLGRIYKEGLAGSVDLEKAAFYYGKAYDAHKMNNMYTCVEYMHVLLELERYDEALAVADYGFKEYNDVEFMYQKARVSLQKPFGDMNESEAEETLKAIANQFSDYAAESYCILGEYCKQTRRYARAIEYYSYAYESGNADAAVEVGRLYEKGGGSVSSDVNQAVTWYKKAANAGSEEGKRELQCFKSSIFGYRRVSR